MFLVHLLRCVPLAGQEGVPPTNYLSLEESGKCWIFLGVMEEKDSEKEEGKVAKRGREGIPKRGREGSIKEVKEVNCTVKRKINWKKEFPATPCMYVLDHTHTAVFSYSTKLLSVTVS